MAPVTPLWWFFQERFPSAFGEQTHFAAALKFLVVFFSPCQEFNLIDRRELAPLQELIEKLGSKDR